MQTSRSSTWCVALAVIGMGLTLYLFFLHLGLLRGELLGGAVCSGSGMLNCHAVTAGSWGSLWGMPLSLWGLAGYLAVLALALVAKQSEEWAAHAMALLACLTAFFVAVDLALAAVMLLVIRYVCLFCLLSYAVNLLLFVISARAIRGQWRALPSRAGPALLALVPSSRRPAAAFFWGVLLVGIGGVAGLHASTQYVSRGTLGSMEGRVREFLTAQSRVAIEIAGSPQKGAEHPEFQIVEFSDFLCPACQRAAKYNTIMLANHRQDAALVFKYYPLDNACNAQVPRAVHIGACQVAAAAACAHAQGRFWQFHDLVFKAGPNYKLSDIEPDAMLLGLDMPRFKSCLASGEGMEVVKRDIAQGVKIQVGSTPTYVINGTKIPGGLPPSTFDDIIRTMRETPGLQEPVKQP